MRSVVFRWAVFLGLVLTAGSFCPGCGERPLPPVGAADPKALDAAPGEAKDLWVEALAALQTNGTVAAYSAFKACRHVPGLSEPQIAAIDGQCRRINETLSAAALKGDAKAKETQEQLRQVGRGR
jgi:hypothetical protein